MPKKSIPHEDSHKRMNFLYQAAHMVANTNPDLARHFNQTIKKIASRNVLRM